MPLLELENVNYIYAKNTAYEKHVLKDVCLKIEEGELIGVIGRTGSGKSTLVQHFNGLLKPDSGRVMFNGKDICDKDFNMRQLRGRVGLVFQYPEHQLFETTVLKDVSFGPANQGLTGEELTKAAEEALRLVGIDEKYFEESPFDLSGGQKRRVALAGVIAMRPEVLVLDEPCAGLDPIGRKEMFSLIKRLRRERNITVILVSHSMEDVAEYTERLIVMNDGEIAMDAAPKEVFTSGINLKSMGLAAPVSFTVIEKMRELGIKIEGNPITPKEAANAILKGVYND